MRLLSRVSMYLNNKKYGLCNNASKASNSSNYCKRNISSLYDKMLSRRCSNLAGINTNLVHIKDEVYAGLNYDKPIVALESTIITHGMPYPDNYHTAITVENIIREQVLY